MLLLLNLRDDLVQPRLAGFENIFNFNKERSFHSNNFFKVKAQQWSVLKIMF